MNELVIESLSQGVLVVDQYGVVRNDRDALADAAQLFERVWERTQGRLNTAQLPWLAWFDDRVGPALIEAKLLAPDAWSTRRLILAQGLDTLADQQIIDTPKLGPDDVLGGFQLRASPLVFKDSYPRPDWTTALPLAYVAVTLRDDAQFKNPADRFGPLITAQYAARFLQQLMMDAPSCFGTVGPENALGGVRLTLWDNRLEITASAMSLLAIDELRHTLRTLGREAN